MTWPVDPAAINTALLIGVAGYLWRQTRKVDELRQVLIGYGGANGALAEIKMLRQRSHELANAMQTLNLTVGHLSVQLEDMRTRMALWDGQNRRKEP